MRAKVSVMRFSRACASAALVVVACSDEATEPGNHDSVPAGASGAGGSVSGASGAAGALSGASGAGAMAGGSQGGSAGALGGASGMSGDAGEDGMGGEAMGGEAGAGLGGEAGEGAAGESGGMGGSATAGAGTGGTAAGGGGMSGAGTAGAGMGGAGMSGAGGAGAGAAGAGAGAGGAGAGGAGAGAGGAGASGAGAGAGGNAGSGGTSMLSFETRALATDHVAEGADAGDIDGDGVIDLVAGPRWYKGRSFALGGTLMPNPPTYTRDQYSLFFLTFVDDLDADGYPDVIGVADAGGANGSGTPNAHWYQNPGPGNFAQTWTKRPIYGGLISNESPLYVNLLGSATKELVFMTNRVAGYARPGASPTAAWTFTGVTSAIFAANGYVHGLGAGDIDGDGLSDIVERTGWWRQTASATWERRAFEFWMGSTTGRPSNWGGAQMPVFDVDGDGDMDVVSSLAAHNYGMAWFERTGTGASITFTPHQILSRMPGTGNFSQAHAMVAADVNGDGLTDIIAGKRYYAHPSSNPDQGTTDPPILVWFELQRSGGTATFVPHQIHADSGAGCNFVARDLTGDGKIDIFTTNKRGTFLHIQR